LNSVFLTASWRYLAMANFAAPPELLEPHLPRGTELDTFDGVCYVSVVAFLFLDTRLKGIPIPFHRDFEEVNLRFYVSRRCGDEVRRGVVFIKEIVPKPALAIVARLAYNENYVHMPMDHKLTQGENRPEGPVGYRWKSASGWNDLALTPSQEAVLPEPGSLEEYITEHYWGYARQRDGGTTEYRVAHPQWQVWPVTQTHFNCHVEEIYGADLAPYLKVPPHSSFLAQGSEVAVYSGTRIV